MIPGNHDVYTLGALQQKAVPRSCSRRTRRSDGRTAVEFPLVRVRGEVAIIGLSTRAAVAAAARRRLARLGAARRRSTRRSTSLDGKFRVLALHHPPYTNRHSILRGLRDRTRAAAGAARAAAASSSLHGHEHRDLRVTLPGPRGPIPVIGVGSGTYDDARADRRARYNVYTIEGGRLVSVETRVHDAAAGRFATAATPPKDPHQAAPAQP